MPGWFDTIAKSITVYPILLDVYEHFRNGEWQKDGGLKIVASFHKKSVELDVRTSESGRFVMPFSEIQETIARSRYICFCSWFLVLYNHE